MSKNHQGDSNSIESGELVTKHEPSLTRFYASDKSLGDRFAAPCRYRRPLFIFIFFLIKEESLVFSIGCAPVLFNPTQAVQHAAGECCAARH
jgi:hypothetical protein